MPPPECSPNDDSFYSPSCYRPRMAEQDGEEDDAACFGSNGAVCPAGPHFQHAFRTPEAAAAPAIDAPPSGGSLACVHMLQQLRSGNKDKDVTDSTGSAAGKSGNDRGNSSVESSITSSQASRDDLPFRSFALCDRDVEALQLREALDRGCYGCRYCDGILDRLHDASRNPSPAPASWSQRPSRSPCGGRGELVLVTGPSGCGKTLLVESVVHSALRGRANRSSTSSLGSFSSMNQSDEDNEDTDPRGIMTSGKFDQLERREQYYAVVQALTEYALIVSRESSPNSLSRVRRALAPHRDAVRIVADLVPELQALLVDDSDHESNEKMRADGTSNPHAGAAAASPEGGAVARERLQLGLRRFLSSVCSPSSPVVLFLDDLQWAEPASLDLLASLFTDPIPGLVVIGACRDNEVDPASYLCGILRELEEMNVNITQILVSNVKETALVAALVETFGLASDKAQLLAHVLFGHTTGNMFFVTQLVQYLVGEGLLYKQKAEAGPWTFDSEQRIRDAISNVKDEVELLAIVIQKQAREVQDTLMVTSCLGAEFNERVLKAAVTFDVTESLRVAEHMGFLKRSAHDPGTWRFVHDRIQESAYSLIPIHEREQVHLRIGRNLWGELPEPYLDVHAHVVVKQLRMGVRLIADPVERELLATLLLRVGEMAARASAHVTAQEYVSLGIKLLEKRHWRDQYSLSLALYNAAAEIAYCLANFDRMDVIVEVIMENARGTKDRIRAQTARIYALGSRNELDAAIDVGLATLKDFFGERVPARPSVFSILMELKKTRRLLRGLSDDSILSLPTMDDSQTYGALRIMSLLMVYVVLCRPELAPILTMRIVQHSLRRGLCSMSSTGFAGYGMVLATFFNEVETGIRYGNVALRIVDRFDAMDQLARASTVAHCFCLAHTEPLPTILQPLRLAHRAGMGSGDIEHSLLAAGMYTVAAVYSHRHLSDLSSDVSSFMALTAAYRHSGTHLMFGPFAQLIECLQGAAPDPRRLSGTYLDWESALRQAQETKHPVAESTILTCKLILECIFRKVDDAEASANDLAVVVSGPDSRACFMRATAWLYQGLAYVAQSHKDGVFVRRRLRRAKHYHRQLVRLSHYSELNYGGKALLLGAEIMVATGSYHQGLLQYEAAVALAKKAEAWGDAAMACERLSSSLQAKGRSEESLIFLNQASRYYELWGATAKVAELQSAILDKSARLEPQ